MTDSQIDELLEAMSSGISSKDEARQCLTTIPKELDLGSITLFAQLGESKSFVAIDEKNFWIATGSSQDVGAGTFLKAAVNVNPISMLKNQAKLVKAGIDLAKGSNSYSFKNIPRSEISQLVPCVEVNSWAFDTNEFTISLISQKHKVIQDLPFKTKEMPSIEKLLQAMNEALGKESIESGRFIGHLDSEGMMATMFRKQSMEGSMRTRDSASSVDIWTNRIVATRLDKSISDYRLDANVKSELYVDGELVINYTTNRVGSASHGSIGLNLLGAAFNAPTHNKKKDDTRTVTCQIIGSDWAIEINLNPSLTNKARSIVSKINQLGEKPSNSQQSSHDTSSTDLASSLAKLAELKAQGLLNDDEFEKAKSRLLS